MAALVLCVAELVMTAGTGADDRVPAWRAVTLSGGALGCVVGAAEERVALLACHARCAPIPWQLDERREDGDLLFTQGVLAAAAEGGRVDARDELTWMVADAGRRMAPHEARTDARCRMEVHVTTAAGFDGWVYAEVLPDPAPRAAQRYVRFDPATDTAFTARAALGFRGPTPRYLGLGSAEEQARTNVLDRLKIRAAARFLGLIPMSRDEDDFESSEVSWRDGPVRVIRRQRQRIRLGFGIRSPKFTLDATVYRDFAELPVLFRLNFPPTYFFGGIVVRALLDFRDLAGWGFLAPGLDAPLVVGSVSPAMAERVHATPAEWFALIGPELQIVQVLTTSPSLATLTRRLVYREGPSAAGPEDHPGEMPSAGFELTEWGGTGNGYHSFTAFSYVLPREYGLERFLRERGEPLAIEARPITP